MADIIKLIVAVIIMVTATVLFYSFEEYALFIRVLGLLVAAGLALLVASKTAIGKTTLGYIRDTQVEVRKVVWPTRQETIQTTLIVVVMVFFAAIMLWAFDSLLGWAVRALTS
jgi:preprotein translocase subunit SecE